MAAHPLSFENIHLPQAKSYYLRRFHFLNEPKLHIPSHFHMLGEIMLFEKMAGQLSIDGQSLELNQGLLVFIPSLAIHEMEMDGDERRFSLFQFQRQLLQELNLWELNAQLQQTLVMQLSPQQTAFLSSHLAWLESIEQDEQQRMLTHSLLRSVLVFVASQQQTMCFDAQASQLDLLKSKSLSKIIPLLQHLENQQSVHLSLQQAADICGMSKYHFSRVFKSLFAQNYKDYILKRKINTALNLLTETERSVAEIAYACDFSDSAYFCAKFKQVMGLAPGRFRRSTQTVSSFD